MEQFKGTSTGTMLWTGASVLLVLLATRIAGWLSSSKEATVLAVALVVVVAGAGFVFFRARRGARSVPVLQALLLAVPIFVASGLALFGVFRRRKSKADIPVPQMAADTASEEPADSAAEASPERMAAVRAGAARALVLLKDVLPGLVWRALRSAFLTGTLGLFVGLVVAALVWLVDRGETFSAWLHLLQLVLMPAVFAIAGAYVGAFRGFLAALVDALQERELAQHVVSAAKPIALGAVSRLEGRASANRRELARALYAEGRSMFAATTGRAAQVGTSLRERGSTVRFGVFRRLQQRIAASIYARVLTVALLPPGDPTRAELLTYYETLGVQRLDEALGESVFGLFATQRLIVMVLALLAASAPYAIALVVTSP